MALVNAESVMVCRISSEVRTQNLLVTDLKGWLEHIQGVTAG